MKRAAHAAAIAVLALMISGNAQAIPTGSKPAPAKVQSTKAVVADFTSSVHDPHPIVTEFYGPAKPKAARKGIWNRLLSRLLFR
jgi:hypothetical protein